MSEFYSQDLSGASEEYQNFRDGLSKFLSGVSVTYEPNPIVTRIAADRELRRSGNSNGNIEPRSVDGWYCEEHRPGPDTAVTQSREPV